MNIKKQNMVIIQDTREKNPLGIPEARTEVGHYRQVTTH